MMQTAASNRDMLLLGDGAEVVLAYFNGTGPAPAPSS